MIDLLTPPRVISPTDRPTNQPVFWCNPSVLLPSLILSFFLNNYKVFLGQMGHAIPPACSQHALWSSSSWMCYVYEDKTCPGRIWIRHPNHLNWPFNLKVKQFYSTLLLKVNPITLQGKVILATLYFLNPVFVHLRKLMITGEKDHQGKWRAQS